MTATQAERGKASVRRDGPGAEFLYVEPGHAWSGEWDPRNTGAYFPMMTSVWDEPADAPIDAAARERLYDAVWALGAGPDGLLEEVGRFSLWIAKRWKRGGDGFLLNFLGGEIQYMELEHTLRIPTHARSGAIYEISVEAPPDEWTLPEGEVLDPAHRRPIVERVRRAAAKDMWLGANYSWKVTFATDEGTP